MAKDVLIVVIHTALENSIAVLVSQSDTEPPEDNGVNAVKATVKFSGNYICGFLSVRTYTCTEIFIQDYLLLRKKKKGLCA